MKKVKKTLVLTGFMGSGKSSVGQMLSDRLLIPFLDLDREIERGENTSIPEIFKNRGEVYFRELEHHYLSHIIEGSPIVLSLGGGALQQGRNIELIRKNSILIYLKVPADVLYQRLKNDRNRPLLRNEKGQLPGEAELLRRIVLLLEEREESYLQADVTVHIRPQWNIKETTNEVIRVLSEHAPATHTEHH